MGLRAYKRNVARDRMRVLGFEHINKNFSVRNNEGIPNWKLALKDAKAHRAQIDYFYKNKRKIRKIERTGEA